MNIRQLEIFRAVITAGTTSGAALALGVSQPAVSRMISHTEKTLGLRLFERSKGRLIPTDEARQLHGEIEPLFLAVEAAQSRIYDIRDGKAGSIRIVAIPTLANSVIPKVLAKLRETTPDIRVSLDIRRWEQIASQVEANTADLGLAILAKDRPDLLNKPLHTGKLICILPIGHPLSEKEAIRGPDLIPYPFIRMTRSSPLGELIASSLGKTDQRITTAVETRYCNTACSLVQAGVGVGIVDQFVMASGDYPRLICKPFLPQIPVVAYAVVARHRPMSRLIKRVIRSVEQELADADQGDT